MFENLSLLVLQQYWWFLIAVLGALFVFMTFVQGGQTLLYTLAESDKERNVLVNSLGRKWELTFTSLVMFGGALFAAFPLFYAVSFGGAYYVWMAILFSFIIQAVSYEYRKKPDNLFGERSYEILLFINGSVGVFLIGAAVATLFTGGNFIVNTMNLSRWTMPSYGLEALLDPFNVAFGLMLFFLARIQGSMYFLNNVAEESIAERARKSVRTNALFFLPLFIGVAVAILLMSGYGYDPQSKSVEIVAFKFLKNFMAMPVVAIMLLAGTLLVLFSLYSTLFKESNRGIWSSGLGTVLVVMSLFLILGLNNTVYYPSLSDLQSSLSIENSSGSHYTLTAMSYVSLFVPAVLAYIIVVWRAMDREPITIDEVEADSHHY
ncbi:cytochrome d ubiquinol oxidase subunit II [Sulfurimonas sp. HSL3-7]|uniref:cytochrome d ubiquinol oxidase subunit II n=1 Tax=Sulfonitrofixus jiaomeiensis TaxID=3131938 RepID=UPI0031F7A345